jgi:hypothetical protein
MRLLLLVSSICGVFVGHCQEDYVMHLNDSTFNIELGHPYQVKIKNQVFNLTVSSKDTLTYIDSLFSFKYQKDFKVTNLSVDKNVDQLMIMDASGSGILIQAYRYLSPVTLSEMMVEQATKENLANGYDLSRSEYERTISSGQTLKVIKLVQRYKDNVRIYEVATYGRKDDGVAIMTFNMPTNASVKPKNIINLMWQSLWIK